MEARLSAARAAPEAIKPVRALHNYMETCGLEPSLLELVKTRASQINGCAYCVHLHTRDARARGETEERLYLLSVWRESPLYTDRERAALAWTEALTEISLGVDDDDFDDVREHFSEKQLAHLSVAIGTINAWNRISVGFRFTPELPGPRAVDLG